jgi:excisionase family DNA binding protein
MLTASEAARYLDVSQHKISRLIRSGELPVHENPNDKRSRLISQSDLDRVGATLKSDDPWSYVWAWMRTTVRKLDEISMNDLKMRARADLLDNPEFFDSMRSIVQSIPAYIADPSLENRRKWMTMHLDVLVAEVAHAQYSGYSHTHVQYGAGGPIMTRARYRQLIEAEAKGNGEIDVTVLGLSMGYFVNPEEGFPGPRDCLVQIKNVWGGEVRTIVRPANEAHTYLSAWSRNAPIKIPADVWGTGTE